MVSAAPGPISSIVVLYVNAVPATLAVRVTAVLTSASVIPAALTAATKPAVASDTASPVCTI